MAAMFRWLLLPTLVSVALVSAGFWEDRDRLLTAEAELRLGGRIVLDADEVTANAVLTEARDREYGNSKFPPAMHFFDAKPLIEQSQVYKIIRMMPKGGVLHAHETSMASTAYLLRNLTYRPDLHACVDAQGAFKLRFLGRSDADADASCAWTPLADMRRDVGDVDAFDRWLERKLTLFTEDPALRPSDANAAWAAFEDIFRTVGGLLAYRPVYEDYIYQFLTEFHEDRVMYIELRTKLQGVHELDGRVLSGVETAAVFAGVVARFQATHPDFLGVRLILSESRRTHRDGLRAALERCRQLQRALPDLVAGFDLVGQEDKGRPLEDFVDDLLEFTRDGYKIFCHAGETNWQGTTDLNVVDALLLNATRIGHAFALPKHPLAMRRLQQRDVAVELNPVSNQVLMLVQDLRTHPGAALLAEDMPVVVSCDGPSFWGATGLSHDLYAAFMGLGGRGADLRTLKQLAINSIRYSVMPEEAKREALGVWERQWTQFIRKVIDMDGRVTAHSEL